MTIRVYTEDNLTPETWTQEAACAEIGGDAWFPEPKDEATANRAKRICKTVCDVREQCLEYALRTRQRDGVWGGYTAKSLQAIRRRSAA